MKLEIRSDDEEINEVCKHYWGVNKNNHFPIKISEILEGYRLTDHKLKKLVRENSTAYSPSLCCIGCDTPYEFDDRADYQNHDYEMVFLCYNCNRSYDTDEEYQKYILAKDELRCKLETPVVVSDLNITDAIYLLSLIRHSASEDLRHIEKLNTPSLDLLTPRESFSIEIIEHLYSSRLIAVDPSSDLKAIYIDENEEIKIDIPNTQFIVLFSEKYETIGNFIIELENKVHSIPYWQLTSLRPLAEKILLEECLSFIHSTAEKFGVAYNTGQKTMLILSKALKQFTVVQIYTFICDAIELAEKEYTSRRMKNDIAEPQATSSIAREIELQYEQALNKNTNVTFVSRTNDTPQSNISRTLFNTILKSNDGGFTQQLSTLIPSAHETQKRVTVAQ